MRTMTKQRLSTKKILVIVLSTVLLLSVCIPIQPSYAAGLPVQAISINAPAAPAQQILFNEPVVDMPTCVYGRLLTPEKTGDNADWIEVATNGDYSLIVRTDFISWFNYPGAMGVPSMQVASFGNLYQYVGSNIQKSINNWFNPGISAFQNLSADAKLRDYTVKNNAISRIGTCGNEASKTNGISKPIAEPDRAGNDVAFALSWSEAYNFIGIRALDRGIPTYFECSQAAQDNFNKLKTHFGHSVWLRSAGDVLNTAGSLEIHGQITHGRIFQSGASCLIYPAIWVNSAIFGTTAAKGTINVLHKDAADGSILRQYSHSVNPGAYGPYHAETIPGYGAGILAQGSDPASGTIAADETKTITYQYTKSAATATIIVVHRDSENGIGLKQNIFTVSPGFYGPYYAETFPGYGVGELTPGSDPASGTIAAGQTKTITYSYAKIIPLEDIPIGVDGRILTYEKTGDYSDWIEIARNGPYSLILRKDCLSIGSVRFSVNNHDGYIYSDVRDDVNKWFKSTLSQQARLRSFTMLSDAINKPGAFAAVSGYNNYSKPSTTYARSGDDVAFLLSFGEAASFSSMQYATSTTTFKASPSVAQKNFKKLNKNPSAPFKTDFWWLRSYGHHAGQYNNASSVGSHSVPLADCVYASSVQAVYPHVRPALWVESGIFESKGTINVYHRDADNQNLLEPVATYTVNTGAYGPYLPKSFPGYGNGVLAPGSDSASGVISMDQIKNITYLYSKLKCIVTYDPNDGDGTINKVNVDFHTDYTVVDQGYTRAEYIFDGWNTSADGTGTKYINGQVIFLTEDVTLYAQWKYSPSQYTITYMPGVYGKGGSSEVVPAGSTYTIKTMSQAGVAENSWFVFKNWNTELHGNQNKTGVVYEPWDVITVTEDLILYAQWIDEGQTRLPFPGLTFPGVTFPGVTYPMLPIIPK